MSADCRVGQVADREWWCYTHKIDAEECEASGTDIRLATATRAVMRHMGYEDPQISAAEAMTHETAGCDLDDVHWNCWYDDGASRHPVWDELCSVAEILRVGFEAVGP